MSNFIISLDFELLWGVRDHHTHQTYGSNILGAREAIPQMLDVFKAYDVAATWATVGLLFCQNRDEVFSLAETVQPPKYVRSELSNFSYLDEIGKDEKEDPYYFGYSLLMNIKNTPKQEIATHTFSHYYCLEDGACMESFNSDLNAVMQVSRDKNVPIRSIVFPRNQYSQDHIDACFSQGIRNFRGNPPGFIYRPGNAVAQTKMVRALRLMDAHAGLWGSQSFALAPPAQTGGRNIPASRFLRPKTGTLGKIHPLHIAVIKRGMSQAARSGTNYHLWWHPHNFGKDIASNIAALKDIVLHFQTLRDTYGWSSATMESA